MQQIILFAVIAGLLVLSNGAAVQSSDTEVIVVTTDGVSKGASQLYQYSKPVAELQRSVAERRILTAGTIGVGDRLIYRNYFQYEGSNLIFKQVFYQGWTPITAIHVTEIGNNLHTVAEIVDGGIGQVYATIRLAYTPGGNGLSVRIAHSLLTFDMWG